MSLRERLRNVYVPPLAAGCVFFCLGIATESFLKIPPAALLVFLAVFLIACGFSLRQRRACGVLLLCVSFFLGAQDLAVRRLSSCSALSELVRQGAKKVTLQGTVVSDIKDTGTSRTFRLRAQSCGEVLVRFYGPGEVFYADEVTATGRLYKHRSLFILSVKNVPGALIRTGTARGLLAKRWALSLKHRMKAVIAGHLAPFAASILSAMVLGESRDISPVVKEAMIRAGTWHVLVVSGSHTALVAFMLLLFLKLIRIPRKPRLGLTMAFLGVYCLMTGACAPVVRATLMAQLFLLGFLIERKPLFWNTLSAAALGILGFDPAQLFATGFQLSFLSVVFIVGLSPKIKGILEKGKRARLPASFVLDVFCVSLSAWLGTAVLLACAFGRFSPVTVLANMVVVPLAMVITAGGFVFMCASALSPALGTVFAGALEFLISCFFEMNFFLSKTPWASFSFPAFSSAWALAYYSASLAFLVFFRRKAA